MKQGCSASDLRFMFEIGIDIGIGIERKIALLYGKLNRKPRIHYIKETPHLIQLDTDTDSDTDSEQEECSPKLMTLGCTLQKT